MAATDLFTREMWEGVGRDLRWTAKRWWNENRDAIVGLAQDELADVMYSLRTGNTAEAKIVLARKMSDEEWQAYRDGTTKALSDLAQRRFALFQALEKLGRRAAKVIAGLVLARLGL